MSIPLPPYSSRFGYESPEDRRIALIDDSAGPDACWPWTGLVDHFGYGRAGRRLAHRATYAAVHGSIPAGLVVMHSCDNPRCCNPAHLVAGTQADNMADMVAKGRQRARTRQIACVHGHVFTERTVYLAPDGRRRCRICRNRCGLRSARRARRMVAA